MISIDLFPETQLKPAADTDERFTPRALFDPLNQEFRFDLDVCASMESAKCVEYYTKATNGLKQTWRNSRVWCNPPFSDIRPWVEKAWCSDADLVVMLVPAWTDRKWWQELIEPYRDERATGCHLPGCTMRALETRFIRRVKFGFPGNPEGKGTGTADFWPCLLIWSCV